MKSHLLKIGDSHDVCIPPFLLEQAGLVGEIEVRVEANSLVIQAAKRPRQGWAEAFHAMSSLGDDALVDDVPAQSSWDDSEWQW